MAAKVPFGDSFLGEGNGFQGCLLISSTVALYSPQVPEIFSVFVPGEKYDNLINAFRNQESN